MNHYHLLCPEISEKVPNHNIVQRPEQTMGDETYCEDFQLLRLTSLKFGYQLQMSEALDRIISEFDHSMCHPRIKLCLLNPDCSCYTFEGIQVLSDSLPPK
jgi:hypothetical protein